MRYNLVLFVLGWLLVFFSMSMIPSLIVAAWFGTGGGVSLTIAIVITVSAGAAMRSIQPNSEEKDILPREGFLIVSGGWILCSLFGSLPFLIESVFWKPDGVSFFYAAIVAIADSIFESASGLTTTGASVFSASDFNNPHAILFWRSTTHWLGGMGIIVLSLAILPLIGAGGMQLFKTEAPGPVTDRLKPRIADTAMTLSKVYVLLTVLETGALMLCGMNLYDALCHTFGTVATGGFSTHPQSVGGFDSAFINLVITFFMIVAGANFALHYRFMKGEFSVYLKNGEFRIYIIFLGVSTLVLTILVGLNGNVVGFWSCIEHSLFQAVSIMTTTGFCTTDFETWHPMACMLLFLLMFVGGCAGSTGGGIKVIRIILLAKIAYREIYRLLYPAAVVVMKQDDQAISERVAAGITGFFILVGAMFIVSTLLLSAFGADFETAFSATAACLFNIGPGLSQVGPYDNFAGFPVCIKLWLSFCMIVGRLELYSVLILTAPSFWRR